MHLLFNELEQGRIEHRVVAELVHALPLRVGKVASFVAVSSGEEHPAGVSDPPPVLGHHSLLLLPKGYL